MARSSEATQVETVETVEQANGAETIGSMFANANAVFVRVIGGFPIPVPRQFAVGHVCDAIDALGLDMRRAQMLSATAQSNMERGAWSKLSDEEKIAKATEYAATYKMSVDVGAASSLLETAIGRIVDDLAKAQGKTLSPQRRDENVVKIMTMPELVERYSPQVRTMIETILAERHEKKARKASAESADLDL